MVLGDREPCSGSGNPCHTSGPWLVARQVEVEIMFGRGG